MPETLERYIVVGDRLHRRLVHPSRYRRAASLEAAAAVHPRAATAAAAAQERDAVGLDFCRVALVAVLVVPLPGLEPPLHVNLLALREVLLERLGLFAPQHHAVPLGLFLPLVVAIVPHLGRRQVERCHCGPARRVAQLGIATEIAHEDNLVHTAHRRSFQADWR